MKSDDLRFLEKLPNLRHLTLWQSPVKSLSGIESLPQLETLALDELSNIGDLASVGNLKHLRGFRVSTGFGIEMGVTSLRPLSELRELVDLTIRLRVVENDYEALTGLQNLEYVEIPFNLPLETLGFLCSRFRTMLFDIIKRKPWSHGTCRKCREKSLVWMFGKGLRARCVTCEPEKILEQWEMLLKEIEHNFLH